MSEVKSPNIVVNCWSTIGVWGSQMPRCEKLKDVIHCRNCKVYWDAGRQVFDKAIPSGYLDQWTQALAGVPEERSKDSLSIIYFRLGEEWFSLSTGYFVEVSQLKSVHHIPHHSNSIITGLVNVGGSVRLCFSLTRLLGVSQKLDKNEMQHGVYRRYLVVQINENDFVFSVDEVGGVYRYSKSELKQVPATIEADKAALLMGVLEIDGNDVACLDGQKLGMAFEGMING